jgi:hypothetical protein
MTTSWHNPSTLKDSPLSSESHDVQILLLVLDHVSPNKQLAYSWALIKLADATFCAFNSDEAFLACCEPALFAWCPLPCELEGQ